MGHIFIPCHFILKKGGFSSIIIWLNKGRTHPYLPTITRARHVVIGGKHVRKNVQTQREQH